MSHQTVTDKLSPWNVCLITNTPRSKNRDPFRKKKLRIDKIWRETQQQLLNLSLYDDDDEFKENEAKRKKIRKFLHNFSSYFLHKHSGARNSQTMSMLTGMNLKKKNSVYEYGVRLERQCF